MKNSNIGTRMSDNYKNKINKYLNIENFETINTENTNNLDNLSLDILENQFNELLSEYQIAKTKNIQAMKKNIEIYNSSNPYKNKNVKINNTLGYVTNGNVFKKYINGEQTIPGDIITIKVNLLQNIFNLEIGRTIPTNPPLIVGTPMRIDVQSVGNEGSNVIVSGNSKISSSYLGCYKDSDKSHTMDIQPDSLEQIFNYETCKNRAIDLGAKYFGVQNIDLNTGLSQCLTSNDINKTKELGSADTHTDSSVWSINTKKANAYMILQNNCDIYFYDENNNLLENKSLSNQRDHVDKSTINSCTKSNDCQSFIYLQDDNIFSVNKGSSPSDNKGKVYNYDISKYKKYAYPNKVASKGKTGKNWMLSGSGLMPNEWIGSNDGSFYLQMTSDGFLTLNIVSSYKNGCSVYNIDEMTYGLTNANAVYKLSSISNPSLIGKIGYINDDSTLLEYPSNMIIKSNNYLKIENYDSSPYDIQGGVSGSYSNCKNSCSSNPECGAFVLDTNNNCYLKSNEAYPKGLRKPKENTTLYVKELRIKPNYLNTYTKYYAQDSVGYDNINNPILNSTNSSCQDTCNNSSLCAGYVYDNGSCWIKYKIPISNITPSQDSQTKTVYIRNTKATTFDGKDYVNINTEKWNNYVNNNTQMSYDININNKSLINESHQEELDNLETELYLLATQITNKIQSLENKNVKINEELKKSIEKFKKNTEEIKDIQIETNKFTDSNTTNSMLNDSNIIVLKSNYKYIGFSILAIIIIIITINKIK